MLCASLVQDMCLLLERLRGSSPRRLLPMLVKGLPSRHPSYKCESFSEFRSQFYSVSQFLCSWLTGPRFSIHSSDLRAVSGVGLPPGGKSLCRGTERRTMRESDTQ
jgi:hypothetical protein